MWELLPNRIYQSVNDNHGKSRYFCQCCTLALAYPSYLLDFFFLTLLVCRRINTFILLYTAQCSFRPSIVNNKINCSQLLNSCTSRSTSCYNLFPMLHKPRTIQAVVLLFRVVLVYSAPSFLLLDIDLSSPLSLYLVPYYAVLQSTYSIGMLV